MEWEAACRGRRARPYAYGWRFSAGRGNTLETRIGGTTPEGLFANGATPEGVFDLSGNTWDWTSSIYANYPWHPDKSHEDPAAADGRKRVVRGGSWNNLHNYARAAYRNDLDPSYRYYDLGLRLVCESAPV